MSVFNTHRGWRETHYDKKQQQRCSKRVPGKAYIGMVSTFVGASGPVVATACGVIDAVVAGFAAERRIRRLAFATGFFPAATGKAVDAAAGLIVFADTVS